MLASRYIKREKASLVVDLRRSKTSLLNLPVSSQTRGLGAELHKCYRSTFSQVKLTFTPDVRFYATGFSAFCFVNSLGNGTKEKHRTDKIIYTYDNIINMNWREWRCRPSRIWVLFKWEEKLIRKKNNYSTEFVALQTKIALLPWNFNYTVRGS